jgi:hypothetical protein
MEEEQFLAGLSKLFGPIMYVCFAIRSHVGTTVLVLLAPAITMPFSRIATS